MVRLLTVSNLCNLIEIHGLRKMINDTMNYITNDFKRWDEFDKTPRLANHVKGGVIELMPISDNELYSFKLVNGHPNNPIINKQTVVASGTLCDTKSGYPLLVSEMTVLTAIRTAATSALASKYMARKDSNIISIIGTGAQSDFQIIAHSMLFNLREVRYFDTDPNAMDRFEKNMNKVDYKLTRCKDTEQAVNGADIVIVVTACKDNVIVIKDDWVKSGIHINGLGGDCPGKTEMDKETLKRSRVVVEYFEQSFIEGEIQHFSREEALKIVNAHLYELFNGNKKGRNNDEEITFFDSVGFALEDYSVLRMTYDLAQKYNIGQKIDLIPNISDPKNLISVLPQSVIHPLTDKVEKINLNTIEKLKTH